MVKLLSLFTTVVLGIASVTATYIVGYQGRVLDLAWQSKTDFSIVNSHYPAAPAQSFQNQNWTLIPSGNATIIQSVLSGTYLSSGAGNNLGYSQLIVQGDKPELLSIQSFNNSRSFILDINGTYALTAWPSVSGLAYPPVTFERLVSKTSPISNQLWTITDSV